MAKRTPEEQKKLNKALIEAAKKGNKKRAESLLKQGADPMYVDDYGYSAVDYAGKNGHFQTMHLIYSAESGYEQDHLSLAFLYKDHGYVNAEMKKGAFKDMSQEEIDSCFQSCVYGKNVEGFRKLRAAGLKPSATMPNGQSWYSAALTYSHDIVVELKKAGFDPNKIEADGSTLLQLDAGVIDTKDLETCKKIGVNFNQSYERAGKQVTILDDINNEIKFYEDSKRSMPEESKKQLARLNAAKAWLIKNGAKTYDELQASNTKSQSVSSNGPNTPNGHSDARSTLRAAQQREPESKAPAQQGKSNSL